MKKAAAPNLCESKIKRKAKTSKKLEKEKSKATASDLRTEFST